MQSCKASSLLLSKQRPYGVQPNSTPKAPAEAAAPCPAAKCDSKGTLQICTYAFNAYIIYICVYDIYNILQCAQILANINALCNPPSQALATQKCQNTLLQQSNNAPSCELAQNLFHFWNILAINLWQLNACGEGCLGRGNWMDNYMWVVAMKSHVMYLELQENPTVAVKS